VVKLHAVGKGVSKRFWQRAT